MSQTTVNIHVLDAAYKPFPTFSEWAARTSLDTVRWERYNASLRNRAASLSPEVLNRARNVAKRAAALDTGAIEGLYEVDRGFTYTVALETAAWEAALAQKGEFVKSLFEAQLHAYDYVLDLATKAQPISEAAIRALHAEVCRAQSTYRVITAIGPQEQPLPKGQYKALPNHVRTRKGTNHSYAPVDVTPAEMARLVAELRGEAFLTAHPVVQASYAHYGLVVIHPFADGNGRVARALASAFTYRAISMPIVILSEHKDPYLDSLERADAGDFQCFLDFILARCLDTITLVDASLQCATAPTAEQSMAAIQRLYVTRGGYTHQQVDEAGSRLFEAAETAARATLSRFTGGSVTFGSGRMGTQYPVPSGYRFPLGGGQAFQVGLNSAPPVQANVYRNYALLLPKDAAGDDDVQLVNMASSADTLIARVDELIPAITGVLQIRINLFAERVANEMFKELKTKAEEIMGRGH
jgi:Fic family protein